MKFTVCVRPKGSKGIPQRQEINAVNKKQLEMVMNASGLEVVEIVDAIDDRALQIINSNENLSPEAIMRMALSKPIEDDISTKPVVQPQQIPAPKLDIPKVEDNVVSKEDKYFTDNGIQFKISNNKIYKKTWIECNRDDYRIIKTTDKKTRILTESGITIERLDWVEIK